ncbi:hypothetical protein [Cohnella rhizosphaerae]|uniref:Uncharacterized protein n=1 Tax=Cohnella rhizosphaerae TaxID=1457232 RepID=A0A9X4KS22_9BACL|nr:hypothetical protein [Cohnella rhizosphaerae]MDG0809792.1 hypothetical protein [Cohnella rhizosphaerae]
MPIIKSLDCQAYWYIKAFFILQKRKETTKSLPNALVQQQTRLENYRTGNVNCTHVNEELVQLRYFLKALNYQ